MRQVDLMSLNPLLTDKVRLSIMVTLVSSNHPVAFNDLLASLELTKGNLASHLRKLEEEKLILVKKQFLERKPLTTYKYSEKGKRELETYLSAMSDLISNLGGKK